MKNFTDKLVSAVLSLYCLWFIAIVFIIMSDYKQSKKLAEFEQNITNCMNEFVVKDLEDKEKIFQYFRMIETDIDISTNWNKE